MKPFLVVTLVALILAVVILPAHAWQERYTIRPRYPDLNPDDGFLDAGTWTNPYAIYDQYGNQVGTMRPRFSDLNPQDGFLDPGTWSNPYELDWDN